MESYSQTAKKNLDNVIKNFVKDLSKKYNLDKTDLFMMWENVSGQDDVVKDNSDRVVYEQELTKKKKSELVSMCDELEVNAKGNKKDLIKRLVDDKFNKDNIIKSINKSVDSIIISRNKFNNYEHKPTNFVFNHTTKTVIGKQMEDGTVTQLTKADIDTCNQYKFKYNIPTNLGDGEDDGDDLEGEFSDYTDDDEEEED